MQQKLNGHAVATHKSSVQGPCIVPSFACLSIMQDPILSPETVAHG